MDTPIHAVAWHAYIASVALVDCSCIVIHDVNLMHINYISTDAQSNTQTLKKCNEFVLLVELSGVARMTELPGHSR